MRQSEKEKLSHLYGGRVVTEESQLDRNEQLVKLNSSEGEKERERPGVDSGAALRNAGAQRGALESYNRARWRQPRFRHQRSVSRTIAR